jgi:UDP-N-acetyl-L-fucosamine synthase
MKKLKVMTILGTRPEIIRLSRVIAALEKWCDHKLVHTGQNYDYELNEIFFEGLGVSKPDYFLNVDTSSLGAVLGGILTSIEPVLKKENPDAVLILGDTNSAIAGMMAKRMKIPLYHMEAGNRCFDMNVPEEINRRLVDHIADFNLVYTEHARRHLIAEGLPHRRIYKTGSPMAEVLAHNMEKIEASDICTRLKVKPGKFFVVSVHREENVDDRESLEKIVSVLNAIAEKYEWPVILSTHPRTAKRLKALKDNALDPRIQDLPPFGFHDYVSLQTKAYCVLSDSGTIAEESSMLQFPAVTLRTAMERPEAIDEGTVVLTGFDQDVVLQSIEVSQGTYNTPDATAAPIPDDYRVLNTSERVVKLILGTARLSNSWHGVRRFS